MMPTRLLLLAAVLLTASMAIGQEIAAIKIGQEVPPLEFKDIRYLRRTLSDLPESKVIVLAFQKVDCPISKRYMPVLKKFSADYQPRGAQFAGVNVGSEDSIQDVAEQSLDYEIEFPVLKDFDAKAARRLGIERVPEVAVLAAIAAEKDAPKKWRLVYRGRIDDQHRFGGSQPAATNQELKDAIEAVLSDREIKITSAPAEGCLISFDEPQPPKTTVTYAEHIAPLFKKHCVDCHRPETAAPFELRTYQDAVAHADMIAEVVREQRMPPWYGAAKYKHFVNKRGMTADERTTVLHWVRSGKARGDDAQLAPSEAPANASGKWLIGKPDLILNEALPHQIPAEGVIPYRYSLYTHVFLQETWLEAIQVLPDNPAVVHHCNAGFVKLGENVSTRNFLTGYVPGGQPMTLPKGVAVRIPPGALVGIQIHFVPTGKPEKCNISIGFRYAHGAVKQQLRFELLDAHRFTIPAGAPLHPISASRTLQHDAIALGLFSHMHLRGRSMTFQAHRPDAEPETLLVIPNYSFGWQHGYQLEPGKFRYPKGTRLEVVARYDNSAFNPFNPNSKADVREGPQSFDEMINGFVFYVDANEDLKLTVDPKTGAAK